MSWLKKSETEANRADLYQQMLAAREQCKQSLQACRNTFEQVPDFSLAHLLLRMCQCHEEILQLLYVTKQRQDANEHNVPHGLTVTDEHALNNNTIERPLGRLLSFQRGLLQQLRKIIRFQGDTDLAYQLSASVASFQILHDHLVEFYAQLE